jgi:hypothetical protein
MVRFPSDQASELQVRLRLKSAGASSISKRSCSGLLLFKEQKGANQLVKFRCQLCCIVYETKRRISLSHFHIVCLLTSTNTLPLPHCLDIKVSGLDYLGWSVQIDTNLGLAM